MTDWQAKLHNRLKAILTPDEPIAVDSSDEEEEVLEEAQGFMTDIETDNGKLVLPYSPSRSTRAYIQVRL